MKQFFSGNILPWRLLAIGSLLCCLLGAAPRAQAQIVIFNTPGGGALPTGWSSADSGDEDIDQGSYYLLEAGQTETTENVQTTSYNLAGYTAVSFSVDIRSFASGTHNALTVQVSTDGGVTFPQVYTTPITTAAYITRTVSIATVSATTVIRLVNLGAAGRGIRLQNLYLEGIPPALTSITTGTITGSPFCIAATGVAVNVPYTISGTYTGGNVFTAQLSDASGSFVTATVIGTRTATNAGTINATLPTSVASGTGYRIRVVSSTPATTGVDNGTNLTITNAANSVVTALVTGPANGQIALQWDNPTSCFDGVLVVARQGSPVSAVPSGAATYTASATFGSGTALAPGEFAVYQGSGTGVTVTGLTNGLTYHFAVYARRSTVYGPAVVASDVPTAGPALTEVLVPRYIAGRPTAGTTHINRLPYAFRVTLSGLLPSTTYRYANRAVSLTDPTTSNGFGTPIYPLAGGFTRVAGTNPTITPLTAGFGTLTTSASGTYTGWFVLEPSDDARFIGGEDLRMVILLNDGTPFGPTVGTVATRVRTASKVRALELGTGPAQATGIADSSLAPARNFVLLYDNTVGTGRPLAATFVESDGTANNNTNRYTGFYATRVENKLGKWGTLVPNTNAAGVQRIEQRALSNGAIVGCPATDADGVWSSLVSTVNPAGGTLPLLLSAVDAPLQCGVYVGMNPPTQIQAEGNGVSSFVAVRITVNTAPATALTVQVSNAGGGTATVGSDYLFNSQSLVFPTSGTYPMTQTVNAEYIGDVLVEANEFFRLSVTVTSGTATVLESPGRMVIADDDFLPTGLIINEISKGPSGSKEYVELLVTGTPGTSVDLRGWTLDDNNGIFSGATTTGVGISAGHFRFDNHCTWEKVRVGSIIVVYNEADLNAALPPTVDPTDGDLDFLYVVPVRNTGGCGTISGASGYYLDGNCTAPSTSSATYTDATVGPRWSTIAIGNTDAIQLRRPGSPEPTLYHGISFATSGSSAVNALNHPDYATLGTNSLFFQGNNQTYYFSNANGNDFRDKLNWAAQVGSGQETPGTPNGVRNGQFIESLRQPSAPVTSSASYTCDVRPNETRIFQTNDNRLILRLANQSSTDYGAVATQTVVGSNAQNTNLEGDPIFMGKQYIVTPTTASPATYLITFYVTDAELASYASFASATTGQPLTATFLRSRLQIYKNTGTVLPSVAPDGSGMVISSPIIGSYSSGVTTYSATFASFSAFALGATTNEVLPVELTRLTATAAPNHAVRVDWATASEKNADYFEVQRSTDGREFSAIGQVAAHGSTQVPQVYTFLDGKPAAGLLYYRLRQVDLDGKAHLSDIVTVRLGAPTTVALEAWPVPMDKELHLRLTAPVAGAATLRIIDLQGRAVVQRTVTLAAGTTELLVPTESLAAGSYLAEVQLADGSVARRKVVK